jgi:hypothetical protein
MTTVQIDLPGELAHTLGHPKFAARVEHFGTHVAALVALTAREVVDRIEATGQS